ncbi:uncharacterized protein M6B38_176685 [Iris pallida]|uniref:DUF4378 domain-containing protein n=1 Tax=Iris pallida TaxID=29817 RepID=A0AAX6EPE8_IRIPA|nr:uncharacterized protein M6B38_176685 [Iris pallida]
MSKTGFHLLKGNFLVSFLEVKKSGTEKHIPSPSVGTIDILNSSREETRKRNDASSESFCLGHPEASMLINSEMFGGASSTSNSLNDGQKHVTHSAKQGSLSSDKSRACEISRDNQDQPSPISVLETQFEDDSHTLSLRFISAISGHPQALSRSSPIESISRTLTRDSPHLGRPLSNSSKLSKVLSKECEEQERFAFVQKLLSSASLLDSGDSTVFARWHSLDSPLDPTLLDEFLDRKEEEALEPKAAIRLCQCCPLGHWLVNHEKQSPLLPTLRWGVGRWQEMFSGGRGSVEIGEGLVFICGQTGIMRGRE